MRMYRYDDSFWADGTQLYLREFETVKETTCGYWVKEYLYGYIGEDEKSRFVLKSGKKRLCYPTKEEALKSYMKRKERQILIQTNQINKAKRMLDIAKKMENKNEIEKYPNAGWER